MRRRNAGGAAAWWLSALVSGILFQVSGRDPLTYGLSVAVLLAAGILACWFPARHATRISPCLALRGE